MSARDRRLDAIDRFHPILSVIGVRRPVSRRAYVVTGVVLLFIKYVLEGSLLWTTLGRWLSPAEFLSPFFMHRAMIMATAPSEVAWLLVAIHLPFLWIGASMSVRRAVDAGLKPWWGFLFVVPLAQYGIITALSVMKPTSRTRAMSGGPFRDDPIDRVTPSPIPRHAVVLRMVRAMLIGSALCIAVMALVIHWPEAVWALLAIPLAAFFSGTIATRLGEDTRGKAKGGNTKASAAGTGVKLLLIPAVFYGLLYGYAELFGKPGYQWSLLIVLAAAVVGLCAVLGTLLSVWSVGAYAVAAVTELDRRDLVEEDGAESPPVPKDSK